jgi:hypothetical protein
MYNGFGGLGGEGSAGNFLPTVGRNSIYGDANYGIDLRIARCFHLTERLRMGFWVKASTSSIAPITTVTIRRHSTRSQPAPPHR